MNYVQYARVTKDNISPSFYNYIERMNIEICMAYSLSFLYLSEQMKLSLLFKDWSYSSTSEEELYENSAWLCCVSNDCVRIEQYQLYLSSLGKSMEPENKSALNTLKSFQQLNLLTLDHLSCILYTYIFHDRRDLINDNSSSLGTIALYRAWRGQVATSSSSSSNKTSIDSQSTNLIESICEDLKFFLIEQKEFLERISYWKLIDIISDKMLVIYLYILKSAFYELAIFNNDDILHINQDVIKMKQIFHDLYNDSNYHDDNDEISLIKKDSIILDTYVTFRKYQQKVNSKFIILDYFCQLLTYSLGSTELDICIQELKKLVDDDNSCSNRSSSNTSTTTNNSNSTNYYVYNKEDAYAIAEYAEKCLALKGIKKYKVTQHDSVKGHTLTTPTKNSSSSPQKRASFWSSPTTILSSITSSSLSSSSSSSSSSSHHHDYHQDNQQKQQQEHDDNYNTDDFIDDDHIKTDMEMEEHFMQLKEQSLVECVKLELDTIRNLDPHYHQHQHRDSQRNSITSNNNYDKSNYGHDKNNDNSYYDSGIYICRLNSLHPISRVYGVYKHSETPSLHDQLFKSSMLMKDVNPNLKNHNNNQNNNSIIQNWGITGAFKSLFRSSSSSSPASSLSAKSNKQKDNAFSGLSPKSSVSTTTTHKNNIQQNLDDDNDNINNDKQNDAKNLHGSFIVLKDLKIHSLFHVDSLRSPHPYVKIQFESFQITIKSKAVDDDNTADWSDDKPIKIPVTCNKSSSNNEQIGIKSILKLTITLYYEGYYSDEVIGCITIEFPSFALPVFHNKIFVFDDYSISSSHSIKNAVEKVKKEGRTLPTLILTAESFSY